MADSYENPRFLSSHNDLDFLLASSHKVDVDEALEISGPFGKFQILVQVFFMYILCSTAYHGLSVYFVGENTPWTCVASNTSSFCSENTGKVIDPSSLNFSVRCNLHREEWKYTKARTSSYVAEFDLVCGKDGLSAMSAGVYFIGSAVAGIVCGLISDLQGRKVVLGTSLLVLIASSLGCSFITEVWQLILLRGFIGAAEGICVTVSFVYLGEFIPSSKRSMSSNLFQISFTLSSFLLVLLGYFERNWRKLQLYLTFPCLISGTLFFLLPKSPRWLLVKGKREHAESIISGISKVNGRCLSNLNLKNVENDTRPRKYTYWNLFSNCKVFILLLSQCTFWFTLSLLFLGVTLGASNLGGNMYDSFVFILLPDIPICFVTIYFCNHFGRKKTVLLSMFLSGVFVGAIAFLVESGTERFAEGIFLSVMGKCFLNLSFNSIYIWTFEIFPTVVRSQGFGLCRVFAHLGCAVSPLLTDVLQAYDPKLPFVIMGGMAVISTFFGLVLPETKNCPAREEFNDFFVAGKRSDVSDHRKCSEQCD